MTGHLQWLIVIKLYIRCGQLAVVTTVVGELTRFKAANNGDLRPDWQVIRQKFQHAINSSSLSLSHYPTDNPFTDSHKYSISMRSILNMFQLGNPYKINIETFVLGRMLMLARCTHTQ